MKKKWPTLLLISLVVIIWGIIIFQLLAPKKATTMRDEKIVIKVDTSAEAPPYKLLLNYREPFLGSTYVAVRKSKKTKKTTASINFEQPLVKFKGVISSSGSPSKAIAIIDVDGEESFMKINQFHKGYKLLKFDENVAVVSFQGQKVTIKKSNE